MTTLDDVVVGDPHAAAHNDERHEINALSTALGTLKSISDPDFSEALDARLSNLSNQTDLQKALRSFHVAMKDVATTAVDVLVSPGDSIVEGATLTGNFDNGWDKIYPRVLQSRLREAMQPDGVDGGEGYMSTGSGVYLGGGRFYVTGSGTSVVRNDYGLGRKSMTIPSGNALNILPPVGNTALWILVTKLPGAGSISYTVNGGAATVVDCSAGSATHAKIAITGLDAGKQNNIVATIQTADVVVEGVFFLRQDETQGIRVWEGGHSGYTANDFVTSQAWANSIASIPNLKLVVMSIGRNDQYYNRTPAQLKASLLSLITLIRSKVSTDPSIVLVTYFPQNMDPPGSASPWADYKAKYKEIAASDDKVAVIDIEPLFGPDPEVSTDDRGGLLSSLDHVHPSPAGYEKIGDYLASQLLPQGRSSAGWQKPTPARLAQWAAYSGEGDAFLALGNFSGLINFATLPKQSYSLTATGNLSINTSSMPAVSAGKTASFLVKITQDATGGRTLGANIAPSQIIGGFPFIDPRPNAATLVKLVWDGASWWIISFNRYSSKVNPVTTISSGLPSTLNLAAYYASVDTAWVLTLQQNTTMANNLMPYAPAGHEFRVRIVFVQDGTGSRTLTHTGFLRASGTSPILSTAAGAKDMIEYWFDGSNWWITNFIKGGA